MALLAGGWFLNFPAWQVAILAAAMLLELAGICAVCAAISAQKADFSTATPQPKISGPAAWAAMVLCLIWQLLVFVITAGGIFQWAERSNLVTLTSSLVRSIPVLGQLFSGGGLLFLAIGLAGSLLFGFVLRWMWAAAAKRLANWEMV